MLSRLRKYIAENFFDTKLRVHYKNYILQSLIIFLCITIIMLLYGLFGGIIVASLGASGFIIFVTPHKNGSRARYVIGGYICGGLTGTLFSLLRMWIFTPAAAGPDYPLIFVCTAFICAAAVAVTTFLMITTNTEHPPAAALALGLTADAMSYKTALAALAGVVILCTVRHVLRKRLKDLI